MAIRKQRAESQMSAEKKKEEEAVKAPAGKKK
jgi:hypothetical protein